MSRKPRLRPNLEQLEDRWVPANIRYIDGMLFISNPTYHNGVASLTLTQTNPDSFQVKDGTVILGTYNSNTSIYITGVSGADSITVNLGSDTYTGSLFINSSSGTDTIAVNGSSTATSSTPGAMLGNLTILHGNGNASVALNGNSKAGLTIAGTTNVVTQYGNSTVSLGGSDSTITNGATTFLGDVNLTGFENVLMGTGAEPDYYGGNVNATEGVNTNTPIYFFQGLDYVTALPDGTTTTTVAGNLNITGGNGSVIIGSDTLGNEILLTGLTVEKNLTVNVGSTPLTVNAPAGILGNVFELAGFGVVAVNGNLSYTTGSGGNITDLGGIQVNGNTNIQYGNGGAYLGLENGTAGPTIFNGNVAVNQANGSLALEGYDGTNFDLPVQAQIGGNLQINVQNSSVTVPIDTGYTTIGGQYIVRAGNGTDSFGFNTYSAAPSLSPIYDVNFLLGNGQNTVVLDDGTLTGSIIAGTNPNNSFQQTAPGNIQQPFQLEGF